MQINNRNNFSTQIDNTLYIIRSIRNNADILKSYNLFNIHDVNAV